MWSVCPPEHGLCVRCVCCRPVGLEDYASPIIDAIDPQGRFFSGRIYRGGTLRTEHYQCVKDMARLNRDLKVGTPHCARIAQKLLHWRWRLTLPAENGSACCSQNVTAWQGGGRQSIRHALEIGSC